MIRDFFLAPEAAAPRERAAPAVPPVVVVLGEGRLAPATAAAAALALARAAGHSHAAVCVWPGGRTPGARLPATAAARRGSARLASRGCETDATGRLVRARLPEAPGEAAAAAQRIVAATECPVAIALAGARTPELDVLLTLADAVVLVRRPGDAPALTRLAEAGLGCLGLPVAACEADPGPIARLLATAGVTASAPTRAALAPALESVT